MERKKADPAEYRFESRGGNVAVIQHPVKLAAIDHVAFERRQEYLRRVAEDDDAKWDRECFHIDTPLDLRPAPVAYFQNTITKYDRIDEQVRHRAPKAQHRDVVERFQKAQR